MSTIIMTEPQESKSSCWTGIRPKPSEQWLPSLGPCYRQIHPSSFSRSGVWTLWHLCCQAPLCSMPAPCKPVLGGLLGQEQTPGGLGPTSQHRTGAHTHPCIRSFVSRISKVCLRRQWDLLVFPDRTLKKQLKPPASQFPDLQNGMMILQTS